MRAQPSAEPCGRVVDGLEVAGRNVVAVSQSRRWLNQRTYSAVVISTRSRVRQGLRALMRSVWYTPLMVRASALVLLCTTNSRVTASRAPGTARAPIGVAAQIGRASETTLRAGDLV